MRVSDFYNLNKTQPYLDFVDVPLDTDIEVFIDPSAIRTLTSRWGHECASLLQSFFGCVLKNIKSGNHSKAQELLASLKERNEFHLGFSQGESKGHGFGDGTGETVWDALTKSEAAKTGMLEDLEDTCLLVHGIGPDMISDAVCNILRGPLLKYTQDTCQYYGIELVNDIPSGPIWNPISEQWEQGFVPMPVTSYGPLVLIPKIIVRHRLLYKFDEYYRRFLLPAMRKEEIEANSSLVEVLKNGKTRVTNVSLEAKYGADKLSIINESVKRPHVVEQYKEEKKKKVSMPLSHEELSVIEETELRRFLMILSNWIQGEIRRLNMKIL
tara:strand:+ start:2450 stop:3427 length:978 start_codon:yes stop_codon:yes gene_type:complete